MRQMRGVALAIAATVSVCCSAVNPTGPSPVSATERLVEALQAQGVTVTRGEALPRSSNPFFSVPARVSPAGCFVGRVLGEPFARC